MSVRVYPDSGSIWFEVKNPDGEVNFPICTFWEDGEVILEGSMDVHEYIYPTLEEWEFLAQIVDTNIERLGKEMRGN